MLKFQTLVMFYLVLLANGKPDSTSSRDASQQEPRNSAPQTGNRDNGDTDDKEPFLRFTGELRDQSLTSGDRAQLRCRVESWPNDHMVYTWYKDNMVISEDNDQYRISIRNKSTGTKLIIRELLTSDSGRYRCEASNGVMRIVSTGQLKVSFSLPPLEGHVTTIPEGKCEVYKGKACASLLAGKSIYVDPFLTQSEMEEEINQALNHITDYVSTDCEHYAFPAFCNFVFSPCEHLPDHKANKKKAVPIKLCREDCELMKYDVCANEYSKNKDDIFLQHIFATANCSVLPPTTALGTKCTKTGLPPVSNLSQKCYNGTGTKYMGVASSTKTGKQCQAWPVDMVIQHKELVGGHNFCRNPGGQMKMPWCYTDIYLKSIEMCNVELCAKPVKRMDMVIVLVPSVAIPFVLGCILVGLCFCRKRKGKHTKNENGGGDFTMGKPIDLNNLNIRKVKVPELNATSVHITGEIGDCMYGKVYVGKILSNPHFSTNYPVAVKTLRETYVATQAKEFQRELEVFSELQHENVACLKAIVIQTSLRCMVFEHTDKTDLQEYLVSHSPQADFANVPSSASSSASTVINHNDFIRMAMQIASGMEYLSSNNYIHRDLAARNVLVCGNMDLKISNLGIVRDSYLSSYYRDPQGGQMLPIRWMAPESLQCWQFSDKSTVWSFGVLLWEMFSYGLQPYCGYSNHEVLDVISRRQLLSCPDQCPAKIYSLMLECWNEQLTHRPDFKDLRSKLQGWESSSTGRVTSQLAQGIHRQLASVTKDGNGQYNRFYQTSSIGGSSGITYNSLMGPTPPPPQYSSLQHPGSASSTFAPYPPAPNVVSDSTQYYSSGTTSSHPPQSGQYRPGYQDHPPHVMERNYAGHMPGSGNLQQQRKGMFYRKGPASHSSSSSCASSSRDPYAPFQTHNASGQIRRQFNEDNRHHDNFSPPPPFSGPGNRSLSGVVENEVNSGSEEQFRYQPYPVSNQLHVTTRNLPAEDSLMHQQSLLSGHKVDSSDVSTGSAKASCDSGLPPEETDPTVADPNAPLISRLNPPSHHKSPIRTVVSPRKQT